jgi:hypothetical protein
MKTEHVLFGIVILGALGVIFFGLAPKACVDIQSGEVRSTHLLFPCNAREKALPAGYAKESA